MTKILLLVIAALVIGIVSYFVFFNPANSQSTATQPISAPAQNSAAIQPANPIQTPATTTTAANSTFCSPANLQTRITLSPGAGNVYGNLSITNSGSTPCQLSPNPVTANYAASVKNITVTQTGKALTKPLTLAAGQTVYSQVQYPNGPQCSGQVVPTNVTFVYEVSPNNTISFAGQNGNQQQVEACTPTGGTTNIQIWGISTKPITPQ